MSDEKRDKHAWEIVKEATHGVIDLADWAFEKGEEKTFSAFAEHLDKGEWGAAKIALEQNGKFHEWTEKSKDVGLLLEWLDRAEAGYKAYQDLQHGEKVMAAADLAGHLTDEIASKGLDKLGPTGIGIDVATHLAAQGISHLHDQKQHWEELAQKTYDDTKVHMAEARSHLVSDIEGKVHTMVKDGHGLNEIDGWINKEMSSHQSWYETAQDALQPIGMYDDHGNLKADKNSLMYQDIEKLMNRAHDSWTHEHENERHSLVSNLHEQVDDMLSGGKSIHDVEGYIHEKLGGVHATHVYGVENSKEMRIDREALFKHAQETHSTYSEKHEFLSAMHAQIDELLKEGATPDKVEKYVEEKMTQKTGLYSHLSHEDARRDRESLLNHAHSEYSHLEQEHSFATHMEGQIDSLLHNGASLDDVERYIGEKSKDGNESERLIRHAQEEYSHLREAHNEALRQHETGAEEAAKPHPGVQGEHDAGAGVRPWQHQEEGHHGASQTIGPGLNHGDPGQDGGSDSTKQGEGAAPQHGHEMQHDAEALEHAHDEMEHAAEQRGHTSTESRSHESSKESSSNRQGLRMSGQSSLSGVVTHSSHTLAHDGGRGRSEEANTGEHEHMLEALHSEQTDHHEESSHQDGESGPHDEDILQEA